MLVQQTLNMITTGSSTLGIDYPFRPFISQIDCLVKRPAHHPRFIGIRGDKDACDVVRE
jgi:hypothetical protein